MVIHLKEESNAVIRISIHLIGKVDEFGYYFNYTVTHLLIENGIFFRGKNQMFFFLHFALSNIVYTYVKISYSLSVRVVCSLALKFT